MRFNVNTPPPFLGSVPNVGVLLRPRFSLTLRFRRSCSVSPGFAFGSPGVGGGAGGSPRALFIAAMYADKSAAGGGAGWAGGVGCGVGRGGGAGPGAVIVS